MSLKRGAKKSGKSQLRFNKLIRAREVRVIGPDNELLGVMPIGGALEAAMRYGLDLVEVSPAAEPPVCKIIDFGKFCDKMINLHRT